VKTADILVAAVGHAQLVRGSWIKPGAVVIDVGTNSVKGALSYQRARPVHAAIAHAGLVLARGTVPPLDDTKKSGVAWVGDVHFDEAVKVAGAITPVPGGVGPMTIAMLMSNTLDSAKAFVNAKLPPMELLELTLKDPVPRYTPRVAPRRRAFGTSDSAAPCRGPGAVRGRPQRH